MMLIQDWNVADTHFAEMRKDKRSSETRRAALRHAIASLSPHQGSQFRGFTTQEESV